MSQEKKTSLIPILVNLAQAYLKRLCDVIELASLEARLAVRTLFSLAILFFVACILVFSSWLCLLFLAFLYLVSLQYTPLFAASIITLMNVVLLLTCGIYIWNVKRNLFFPATRKQLYGANNADKELLHEQTKTAN